MRSLDKKLLRDLLKMKGQAFAIALVIVSGVSTYVMLISTMDSLTLTRDMFYRDYGFAEAFCSLKRAPEGMKARIAGMPGVDTVETRVSADVKLDVKGFPEPVTARLLSVSEKDHLNRLFVKKGRMVDPLRDDEVLVSEAFAEAHGLDPGDTLSAVINGKWKSLRVTGTALSPEFVLQVRPGAISPDYKRYAILWMGREALSAAYDMKGAFNDVALALSRGAREEREARTEDILDRLDSLLARYGGLGSYGRGDQLSHRYLNEEFKQLRRSASIFPGIFIGVAAFLLNVVISRIVSTQRDQIATLKAFGYSTFDVGLHYVKLITVIVLLGVAGGLLVGIYLAGGLGRVYMEFYRFPYLQYELRSQVAITAALISVLAALSGTVHAVWRAVKLPPAEAMRPEPPARYRKTFIEAFALWRLLAQPTRIIIRNVSRRPVKSLLTSIGISLACAIMIAGMFSQDAIDYMVDVQFRLSQKDDMAVTFTGPVSKKALFELQSMPGVGRAEVYRSVPARLRFGHRNYRTSIKGIEPDDGLHILLDSNLKKIEVPPDGIILTDYLGKYLGAGAGDTLIVEALEGARPVREVKVYGLVKQFIGLGGYMDMKALNRLMREGDAVTGAYLSVDSLYRPEIYRRLIEMPRVAGTALRREEIKNFYDTQAEALLFFTFVATILAGTIAFGVVYNSARISLSERSRELASLRVLGYTRAEISYIFLGELAFFTLASLPLGFLFGRGISTYIAGALESDLFRVPVIIEPRTYSYSALVVVLSALFSGLAVRHKLDRLDLVAVLKMKE